MFRVLGFGFAGFRVLGFGCPHRVQGVGFPGVIEILHFGLGFRSQCSGLSSPDILEEAGIRGKGRDKAGNCPSYELAAF